MLHIRRAAKPIAMASDAHPQISATCSVRNPIPPDGASESEKSRLLELCKLRHCKQKGKDSLELRGQMANLGNSAYYNFMGEDGIVKKPLKNKEFLIAWCLRYEGRESAVPVGWFTAAPPGQKELDVMLLPPAPQPVVYDMPSVPPLCVLQAFYGFHLFLRCRVRPLVVLQRRTGSTELLPEASAIQRHEGARVV